MKKIIIYDFDGTLTPYSMPKFEILEKYGMINEELLELAKEKLLQSNGNLYKELYQTYFEIISNNGGDLVDENFSLGADKVIYNKDVIEFLNMIKENGIKNYLLSSGLLVYLKKTKVANLFEEIFATTFKYNQRGEAIDIDYLMSDKNKVEAIKKIVSKNNKQDNDCTDIIYIGDGLTDSYAMEYVKNNGGTVIFVYNDEKNESIEIMKEKDIVDLFTKADYSIGSELNNYIKKICEIK